MGVDIHFNSGHGDVSDVLLGKKNIGVTEGWIRVIQWPHTIVQRHLRNKEWVESNKVVEIAKLDAQKELLFCSESNQYPGCNIRTGIH
jgi:hypothetical protein